MEPVWSLFRVSATITNEWIFPRKASWEPLARPFCQETGVDRNEISNWGVLRVNPLTCFDNRSENIMGLAGWRPDSHVVDNRGSQGLCRAWDCVPVPRV